MTRQTMFDPALPPVPGEEGLYQMHHTMWKLGAAFTEFIRNPSAAAWREMEKQMRDYQTAYKVT